MPRVAGCDPGTSSLDVLVLEDGTVRDQVRFAPAELHGDPARPAAWLRVRGPFDLIAGPSGYGLPLVRAAACSERDLALLSLVRPDERGRSHGVAAFSAVVRALCDSGLPVVFLPGVIHLPTVPVHRKVNRIDLGTPDKLCVAALAEASDPGSPKCVLEIGSAFTAAVVLRDGQVVDGVGGTSGPPGPKSGGAWDGEAAYLMSPLAKGDLFTGGTADSTRLDAHRQAFWEGLRKTIGGLRAVHGDFRLVVSGRGVTDPAMEVHLRVEVGEATRLADLPGAWVKSAAQGAALIADGLAGGRFAPLIERLRLREASGTVLDWLTYPRADEVRRTFRLDVP